MEATQTSCWISLASARGMSNRRKMEFLIQVVHEKMPLDEALQAIRRGDRLGFEFTDKEWEGMVEAANEVPNNSFVAERLLAGGIETIHIMDRYVYPASLKQNLKKDAPIVIYAKGNLDLIKQPMVAIVGARKAGEKALEFTDNVAERAVRDKKVVVSGFAKGVDQRALDATLRFHGRSVIVLPQGIETYRSKDYYAAMVRGDVLIVSTYHPKAAWSVGLAMDRNKTIYGLAHEIYAAESNDSGGTWEGVRDGLKRGRVVYVRQPEAKEKNANQLLIEQGAVAVDMFGTVIGDGGHRNAPQPYDKVKASKPMMLREDPPKKDVPQGYEGQTLEDRVLLRLEIAVETGLTVQDLVVGLGLDDKQKKRLPALLEKLMGVRKVKQGNKNVYFLDAGAGRQGKLF